MERLYNQYVKSVLIGGAMRGEKMLCNQHVTSVLAGDVVGSTKMPYSKYVTSVLMSRAMMIVCLAPFPAAAQMIDTLGSLGISGALTAGDAKNVGTMTRAMRTSQAFQDFQLRFAEILTGGVSSSNAILNTVKEKITFKQLSDNNGFSASFVPTDKGFCTRVLTSSLPTLSEVRVGGQKYLPDAAAVKSDELCSAKQTISLIFQ